MSEVKPTLARSASQGSLIFFRPRPRFGLVCHLLLMTSGVGSASAADWLQFRTANGNSVAAGSQPPAEWSETQNIAWKVELPGRGPSSPIVIGDRVVITASSGAKQDRLHVLCF